MPNSMRANKFERLHRYFSVGWCTGQREIPLGGLFSNSILRFGYWEAWYFKPSFLGKLGFALCYIKGILMIEPSLQLSMSILSVLEKIYMTKLVFYCVFISCLVYKSIQELYC